ncbi:E3 ubiquitin-protein ligase TRIM13 [Spea bombifrons]|uniref:E3 ubiquitin-protein ligase TRIM13 n=1 Tax=Spea bombifrons TaxID=233779 RepID=UPI00234B7481|nr:E3 ubiquitin-protein ligase TRIM13 [Spea bombifrons]
MMEMLEEELTCPVCHGIFEDPCILPCSHSFCKKCLEGILGDSNRNTLWRPMHLKCPTCRKDTSVMSGNGHQVNYLLKGIVEKYNKTKVVQKMPVCNVHTEQPLNIFCSTDLKLICGFCATREHSGHMLTSIDDAYHQEKSSFQTLFRGFESNHHCHAHSHLDSLETSKSDALHSLTIQSENVNAYFEKLQQVLEQKKNEVLSDFETMKLAVMQAYDPVINKLSTVLNEQKNAWVIAESMKDITDPLQFLQQMHKFREKVQLINEVHLPSASDVTASPMKNFDTKLWDTIQLKDVDKLGLPQKPPTSKYGFQLTIPFTFGAIARGVLFVLLMSALYFFIPYIAKSNSFHKYLELTYCQLSHSTDVATKVIYDVGETCQSFAYSCLKYIGKLKL